MKTMELRVTVNGQLRKWSIAPGDLLLDVLRREGFFGVKRGCEKGECGSCTVLVDGRAVNSCLMFAAKVEGCEVLTIEGVADGDRLDPIQGAFLDHGAAQCGFCTPGMIVSAVALLSAKPAPSAEDVASALGGNVCRCGTYPRIVTAVQQAARAMRKG